MNDIKRFKQYSIIFVILILLSGVIISADKHICRLDQCISVNETIDPINITNKTNHTMFLLYHYVVNNIVENPPYDVNNTLKSYTPRIAILIFLLILAPCYIGVSIVYIIVIFLLWFLSRINVLLKYIKNTLVY